MTTTICDGPSATTLSVSSINVSLPREIGKRRGSPVLSGIDKQPVGDREVVIGRTGIEGDGQADLRNHGGPDKAVYAYPSEHLLHWSAELNEVLGPGAFGENLTTLGSTESDVFIGDIWTWGSAKLQICQPRYPCYKLAMHRGRLDIVARFLEARRSGWYLRVLQPGRASRSDVVTVSDRLPKPSSVLLASQAVLAGKATIEELEMLSSIEELADSWKVMIQDHLSAIRNSGAER